MIAARSAAEGGACVCAAIPAVNAMEAVAPITLANVVLVTLPRRILDF